MAVFHRVARNLEEHQAKDKEKTCGKLNATRVGNLELIQVCNWKSTRLRDVMLENVDKFRFELVAEKRPRRWNMVLMIFISPKLSRVHASTRFLRKSRSDIDTD